MSADLLRELPFAAQYLLAIGGGFVVGTILYLGLLLAVRLNRRGGRGRYL